MTPTRRRVTALLATGTAAFGPLGRAMAQPGPDVVDPAPEGADTNPTDVDTGEDRADRITAPVLINGQGPFNLLVDTGANASCVAERLAVSLKLPAGPVTPVHTVVGLKLRQSVMIDTLQLGARTLRKVRAPVLPIAGTDLDGVLGIDWLKGQRLVLGFTDKRLEITRSLREASGDNRVVVPARRRSGQLTIVDADMGGERISAMIDSGSQLSVGNEPLRRLIQRQDHTHSQATQNVTMVSIAGERFTGELAYIPFMRLGGLHLGNVPVVFADMHVFGLWNLERRPAIVLGMDLLSQFTAVAMDFGRSVVRFDIAPTTLAQR
jgi:predicted aspartyl protease